MKWARRFSGFTATSRKTKVYCVYLAPGEDSVRELARRLGISADRVSAVRRLIGPAAIE